MCIYMMTGTVCSEQKNYYLYFVMQNLGIWRIMGTGGQNVWLKVPYLESPTLICVFTMQLLWATMMIKGSLLLSAPIVKHFWSKKTKSRYGPKFDGFVG